MNARAAVSALTLAALAFVAPAGAQELQLGLPIACEPGKTCWVQQYVDDDPTSAVRDYACGAQTYDGHDGIDIRIRDTGAEADVIASAAGTVRGVRDGVADKLMRSEADRQAVAQRECGNGVVVVHENGWETQYCHMRLGSVAVKAGDSVKAGQKLGSVGFSGMAAFPHVHITVRKDGKALDPFKPLSNSTACGAPESPLWTKAALAAFAYNRGDVLRTGFAPGQIELATLEEGDVREEPPSQEWPAMVSYVWIINLEAGDELRVTLDGPGKLDAVNAVQIDRPKAQYMLFSGKKRPQGGWPKGRYEGKVEVRKDGETRISQSWAATID